MHLGLQHLGLVELAKDWTCLIFFYSVPEFFSPKFLNSLNHHKMPSEPVAGTGSTCGTYWVHGGVFFNVYFAAEMEISCKQLPGFLGKLILCTTVYVSLFVFIWCKPNEDLRIGILFLYFFLVFFFSQMLIKIKSLTDLQTSLVLHFMSLTST